MASLDTQAGDGYVEWTPKTRTLTDRVVQIFILEGILTCVVSAAFFFFIPDFPEDVKWLSEDERTFVVNRLRSEQGASAADRKTSVKDVANVFKDYKIFLGGFMYFGLIVPAYSYATHHTP